MSLMKLSTRNPNPIVDNTIIWDGISWRPTIGLRNPYIWIQHSVNQSIPNDTWTVLTWNLERLDPFNLHDPVNPTRIITKANSLYATIAQVSWTPNGVGGRGIRIVQGGILVVSSAYVPGLAATSLPAGTDQSHQCLVQPGSPNSDGYIEIQVWQNSGAALDCTAVGTDTPSVMQVFIGIL